MRQRIPDEPLQFKMPRDARRGPSAIALKGVRLSKSSLVAAKPHKTTALANARHEQIAQLLARGATQLNAYVEVYKCHLSEDERKAWCDKQRANQPGGVHSICSRPDVRARVNVILDEHHERRMSIEMKDIQVNRAYVIDRLVTLVDRCMQAVPVLNKRGNATGQYRFEANGAVKSLELLGLEAGMFERRHKHLHAKVNPLDGNRVEILGRLGVLLDQLSEGDLESLGLQRIVVVEAV